MPTLKSLLSGLAIAGALFCSNSANATTYVLTATGTVAPGSPDPSDLFGGDNFLGNSPNFKATFTFDSSLNTLDTTSCAPGCAFLVGETSVTVTIFDASASYSYTTSATGPGNALTIKDYLHLGLGGSDSLQGNLYANGGLTQIFALLASPSNDFVPSLDINQTIPPYTRGPNDGWNFTFTAAGDNFDGYTNTIALSSTPLPSTWLMLLSGIVGLGFFTFCRSKKNFAAVAVA
jgi:hypothetical protein